MIKILLPFLFLMLLLNCQDGPKAAFNEEFEIVRPQTKIPYSKLIGTYILDIDSKNRYNIQDSVKMSLQLKKDTSLIVNNFIDVDNRSLLNRKVKSKLYYINDYQSIYLGLFNKEISRSGAIEIYYRKKDNVMALYIYTLPLKGQDNGDYLRYIKVK